MTKRQPKPRSEPQGISRILIDHFFRRFFDNDTLQADGDTTTSVVRAVSVVAAPGLMVAFFLQNQYWRSPPWVLIEDHYFFVLFSFVAMGAVSVFEWEMLFPDRLDFLVLSPLSLKSTQMLGAKAAALLGFLTLFLFGCNFFGTLLLPMLKMGGFLRGLYAHGAAVLLAGVFSALLVLAVGGVLVSVLDPAHFRLASPILQMLFTMAFVLLLLQYLLYGTSIEAWLSEPLGMARWIPSLWFLGVYEQLLRGDAAPAFAHEMTRYALRATVIAAVVVLLTYPMAWARMRKMAIEGISAKGTKPSRLKASLLRRILRTPGERAIFHFIGQTLARNNRYQVYLAMYCGAGLALAFVCAVTFQPVAGAMQPALSQKGLHAILPLLLLWTIAGLRTAFAFLLNLSAGWIFRITGTRITECAAAARRWVLLCAIAVMCAVVAILRLARWDSRHLLVQAVCGLCLSLLLTDGFFFFQQSVPFNRPRMPGRTSLPLMLTLYLGVFPPLIFGIVRLEAHLEKSLPELWIVAFVTVAVQAAFRELRRRSEEDEEEMEGYDGEFLLLGLS